MATRTVSFIALDEASAPKLGAVFTFKLKSWRGAADQPKFPFEGLSVSTDATGAGSVTLHSNGVAASPAIYEVTRAGSGEKSLFELPAGSATTLNALLSANSPDDSGQSTATTLVDAVAYQALVTDSFIEVDDDTAGAHVTVTLPPVASVPDGFELGFVKTGTTGNLVLDGSGAELINGAATSTVTAATQWGNPRVRCNGTVWHLVV